MKDVTVEFSVEATINTGNFQNVKPKYTISATLEGDEHPNNVRAKLKTIANQWLEEDVAEYKAELDS